MNSNFIRDMIQWVKPFWLFVYFFYFLFSNYATMCDWKRENKREHGILSKQRNERKRRQNKRTPGLVFIAITTVSESDGQTDGQQTAGRTPENLFSISLRVDSRGDFFSRSSRFNPPLFFLYSCFKLSENIKIIPFSPWTTLLLPASTLMCYWFSSLWWISSPFTTHRSVDW